MDYIGPYSVFTDRIALECQFTDKIKAIWKAKQLLKAGHTYATVLCGSEVVWKAGKHPRSKHIMTIKLDLSDHE